MREKLFGSRWMTAQENIMGVAKSHIPSHWASVEVSSGTGLGWALSWSKIELHRFWASVAFCLTKHAFLPSRTSRFVSLPRSFGWAIWHSCRMGDRNQWQIRGRKVPNFGWATFGWASCILCPLCMALDLAV